MAARVRDVWVGGPEREMVGVFMVQHSGSTFDARDAFIGMANTSIVQPAGR